jgi:multimeric flavodoxin WrbA
MAKKGFETENVFLTKLDIQVCRQCEEDGWGICHREGTCIIEDDFQSVVDRIDSADVLVFATPVYYGDLSERMKAFTDRLRRCTRPIITRTGKNKNFKPAIGICLAGGGGGGSETCAVNLKKVLSTCGFEMIDMVPVRRQNLDIKMKMMEVLGDWLPEHVTSGEWERVIPRPSTVR